MLEVELEALKERLADFPVMESTISYPRCSHEWVHRFSDEAGTSEISGLYKYLAINYPREYVMHCFYFYFEASCSLRVIQSIRQHIIKCRVAAAIQHFRGEVPDIIGAALNLRLALEHIGAHALFLKKFPRKSKDSKSEEWAQELTSYVSIHLSATRFNWDLILAPESASSAPKGKFSYVPKKGLLDYSATNTMNGIDALEKEVCGSRKVYEMLCELTHPNGTSFGVYQTHARSVDGLGILEINRVQVSTVEVPEAFMNFYNLFLRQTLVTVGDALALFPALQKDLSKKICDSQDVTMGVCRELMREFPDFFDEWSECPCGSGLGVWTCCLDEDD